MRDSLFDVLDQEDLSRPTIGYDWRTGAAHLLASRTWDDGVSWSAYNRSFTAATPLASDAVHHNDDGVLCGYEEYEKQEDASMNNVLTEVEWICTEYTWRNLKEARDLGVTPTENAYGSAENVICGPALGPTPVQNGHGPPTRPRCDAVRGS